jgi:hypothetical protein
VACHRGILVPKCDDTIQLTARYVRQVALAACPCTRRPRPYSQTINVEVNAYSVRTASRSLASRVPVAVLSVPSNSTSAFVHSSACLQTCREYARRLLGRGAACTIDCNEPQPRPRLTPTDAQHIPAPLLPVIKDQSNPVFHSICSHSVGSGHWIGHWAVCMHTTPQPCKSFTSP